MLTPNDYEDLWNTCELTTVPRQIGQLDAVCRIAKNNEALYQAVGRFVSVPWPLIAAIHFRESDQNFLLHLHNGDPLTDRTVHVPKGRPEKGNPPFAWADSAVDALEDTWRPSSWSTPGCLEFLERYNGLGYQKHQVYSPYLWNFTNKYISGLYVADGRFDPQRIEVRSGCVAILKVLSLKGVSLDFTTMVPRAPTVH